MAIYARFPGTNGDDASCPDNAAFSALSDFSLVTLASLDDWTPAATSFIATHSDGGANQRSWTLAVLTGGTIRVQLASVGTAFASTATSTAAPTVNNGQRLWVLVIRDAAAGTVKFYTAPYVPGTLSPPAFGSFTQLGSTISSLTTATLHDSTAALVVAANGDGTNALDGQVYRFLLYTGKYDGSPTLVRNFDPSDAAGLGSTSWTASTTGETWTLNGGDPVLVGLHFLAADVAGAGAVSATGKLTAKASLTIAGAGAVAATGKLTAKAGLTVTGDGAISFAASISDGLNGVALWDSGYTLHIEAAFSASTGVYAVWDVDAWDAGVWGPDIVWSDLTQYVRAWASSIGKPRESDHFAAGHGAVRALDLDARFVPENTASPYASGGIAGVRPRRPIRGYVTEDATGLVSPLFYGAIDDFDDATSDDGKLPEVVFAWVDGLALLAAADGYEQAPQGAGELVGARMHRILDNAEWNDGRTIDVGQVTMQATTLAQPAITEVLLAADSDTGEAWVDPDGTFIYEDGEALLRNTRSTTARATFTDVDGPGALRYQRLRFANGVEQLANVVALSRVGGTVITKADETSRALYGLARFARNDLICETDVQIDTAAQRLLARRKDPTRRPNSFELTPRSHPDVWPWVLGLRVRDRIAVIRNHEPSGVTITTEAFVIGITHEATPSNWVTTIRLASTIGVPGVNELGVWDSSEWNEAAWAI